MLTTAGDISQETCGILATTLAQTKCVWFAIQMGGCSRSNCKTFLCFYSSFFFSLSVVFTFYRFNDEVKHIKVIEKDSWIHITEAKKFESLLVNHVPTPIRFSFCFFAQQICTGSFFVDLSCAPSAKVLFCLFFVVVIFLQQQELVEYYQSHSLKESFKLLDTTLRYPYKSRERSLTRASTRSPGRMSSTLLHLH